MVNKKLTIIFLAVLVSIFVSVKYRLFSIEDQNVVRAKNIFVVLHPELLFVEEIMQEIKNAIPEADVRSIKDTYLLRIEKDVVDMGDFVNRISGVRSKILNSPLTEGRYLSEIEAVREKSVFYNLTANIITSPIKKTENGRFVSSVLVKLIDAKDGKVINSLRYLLFEQGNIYKFLWENSGFLNTPFFAQPEDYQKYLNDTLSSFAFSEKDRGEFLITITSQDERFVRKARKFFEKESKNLLDEVKRKDLIYPRQIWDEAYFRIMKGGGTFAWEKPFKVVVRTEAGKLEKTLNEGRVTGEFTNVYLLDFLDKLREKHHFSFSIKHRANFTGRPTDPTRDLGFVVLPGLDGRLEFTGVHVFSVKAENVRLSILLAEVLERLGYEYEIGLSGGLETLFIEPIEE